MKSQDQADPTVKSVTLKAKTNQLMLPYTRHQLNASERNVHPDLQKTLERVGLLQSQIQKHLNYNPTENWKKASVELFRKWSSQDNHANTGTYKCDQQVPVTHEEEDTTKKEASETKDGILETTKQILRINDKKCIQGPRNILQASPLSPFLNTPCDGIVLSILQSTPWGHIFKYTSNNINNETMKMMVLPTPNVAFDTPCIETVPDLTEQSALTSRDTRTVRTKKNKALEYKIKSVIESPTPRSLCFCMADKEYYKLRTLLIQKNWVQKKINLKHAEPRACHTRGIDLMLILRPYLIDKFWNSVDDCTVVSCFPRAVNESEAKIGKTRMLDWILCDAVSPRTFIINTRVDRTLDDDLFKFINEYLITTCVNVMKFTWANNESLFSQNGAIPLWVLTYAVENCQGMLLTPQDYFSAIIPGQKKPRFNLKMTKEKKKQHQMEMDKQHEFIEYASMLLTESGQFEKSSNHDVNFLQTMKNKLEELGKHEPVTPKRFPDGEKSFSTDFRPADSPDDVAKPSTLQSITTNTWITKTDSSKFYGMRCFKRLFPILNHLSKNEYGCDYYVIQKSISDQFLIHGNKFIIHHVVLIVSVTPLKTIPFKEYNIVVNQCDDSSIYKYEENLIEWSPRQFRAYLSSEGKAGYWENYIQPSIQESTNQTISHNQNRILPRNKSFEIVCTTFILDDTLRPWLTNIKSNPKYAQFLQDDQMSAKIYNCIIEKIKASPKNAAGSE